MRKRVPVGLVLGMVVVLAFVVGTSNSGSAHPNHIDVLINRTVTLAESGRFPGHQLAVYGAGMFNANTLRADLRGAYVLRDSDGKIVARGVWTAKEGSLYEGNGALLESGKVVLRAAFRNFAPSGRTRTFSDFTVQSNGGEPGESGVVIPSAGFENRLVEPHRYALFVRFS